MSPNPTTPDEVETMSAAMYADAERDLGIVHTGGVPWYEAPLPRRWHRCTPQTVGCGTARCACGAIRTPYGWTEKNSTRRWLRREKSRTR